MALIGSMMPSTASTAMGLIVSQFWLTTFDDRHVSTAWISVSLGGGNADAIHYRNSMATAAEGRRGGAANIERSQRNFGYGKHNKEKGACAM